MTHKPLTIYLADLTHVGNGVATEAFPLNVGLIAAYAKKKFGDQVDIRLFKYPAKLGEALRQAAPDILGCSNYTWNANLSYHYTKMVKKLRPDTITVWGGTNYPFEASNQEMFLKDRPDIDCHVFYEGELAFANIIERRLVSASRSDFFAAPLPSVQFMDAASKKMVTGPAIPRIRELDDLPSPYSTGLLDEFFDGVLTPLVETARGCPFRCNYCNAGDEYFNKVNKFSDEYVNDELNYIARRAGALGIGHVTFADNNFGMIPRDSQTADLLHDLQGQYNWPKSITVWTGKNSRERVIDVTRVLGETLSVSMSVQSMDQKVLENIQRGNIQLDHYRKIAEELYQQGRPQHAEVIMPLPGETMQSHIKGLKQLLDTNVSVVLSHTLQMLHGTPYKDNPKYVRDNGYKTKWRVVPLDFSIIDGTPIFDVEEVAIASNTLSFVEYVEARKFLLVVDLCYNSGIFEPLKKYLAALDIKVSDWVAAVYGGLAHLEGGPRKVFESFVQETQSELWDSENDLIAFYSKPENYQKLVDYEMGGNVLFKHRVWMLSSESEAFVSAVTSITYEFLAATLTARQDTEALQTFDQEITSLRDYVAISVAGGFKVKEAEQPIVRTFPYDIPAFCKSKTRESLATFAADVGVELTFAFSKRSLDVLRDAFNRYGTDIAGLVKMVQRTAGVTFSRSVSYSHEPLKQRQATPQHGPGYASM